MGWSFEVEAGDFFFFSSLHKECEVRENRCYNSASYIIFVDTEEKMAL